MEMLVVMLVSSLTITISYTCYAIFSNHYLQYKKNADELSRYILLDKLLTKDISASKSVIRTSEGIECVKKEERIQYEFLPAYVLRRGTLTDTFFVTEETPMVFKNQGTLENIPGALVDEVSMELLFKEEKLYFYYRKEYGADQLILNSKF